MEGLSTLYSPARFQLVPPLQCQNDNETATIRLAAQSRTKGLARIKTDLSSFAKSVLSVVENFLFAVRSLCRGIQILDYGLGAGMDVEFVVDVSDVAVEGAVADDEVADDFFVAEAFR
jgi:hypothetical protein